MCVADAFHISDSNSLSDESAVLDGSCKTSLADIPLTWLLMSKSVVLANSASSSNLGWSCEYSFLLVCSNFIVVVMTRPYNEVITH